MLDTQERLIINKVSYKLLKFYNQIDRIKGNFYVAHLAEEMEESIAEIRKLLQSLQVQTRQ
jgi:hypothetical protein